MFVQQCHYSCLVTRDTSGIPSRLGRALRMLHEVSLGKKCPFLVATVILGFLSIFKNSHSSSPFEALNSAYLSRCQRDVRTPVQMRQGPRAFSSMSTGDSDMLSSCKIKDEPAFKPLQGNPAFFLVRASRCPFHWKHQIQGPSHIPVAEGSLLLRCLWKVGIPLQLKPGNQLTSQDDLRCTELSSSCCADIGGHIDLRRVSQGSSEVS